VNVLKMNECLTCKKEYDKLVFRNCPRCNDLEK